jgi:hypothetical protein
MNPGAQPVNLPGDVIKNIPPPAAFFQPIPEKQKGATWVAKGIVLIFGGLLIVMLVGGFILIGLIPHAKDGGKNIVEAAIIPLLTGVGTFAATVFGPLIAFILGYYFGEKGKSNEG